MGKQKKIIKEEIIKKFRKRFGRFYCDAVKQEVDMEGNLIIRSDEIEEWIVNLLSQEKERWRKEIREKIEQIQKDPTIAWKDEMDRIIDLFY